MKLAKTDLPRGNLFQPRAVEIDITSQKMTSGPIFKAGPHMSVSVLMAETIINQWGSEKQRFGIVELVWGPFL